MSARILQRTFGGPGVLELADQPTPTAADLAADEVLVKVAAAGVNVIDVMTRSGGGMAGAGVITLPFTPGWDLSGTVRALGTGVENLQPGQRVLGMAQFPRAGSAYAQYAVVPASDLVATPDNLTDDQAAALPMAAMTAWQAFTDTVELQPGQRVLITGAGGGVGHLAVQLARHLGAAVVALASTSKHAWLRDLGADETVDYRDADSVAALSQMVDVALSLAGGSRDVALRSVRPGGVLVALGGGAAELQSRAEAAGVRFAATHVHTDRDWLTNVAALAEHGVLIPTVSETFDLANAADAHRAIEDGHSTGKIVLRPWASAID